MDQKRKAGMMLIAFAGVILAIVVASAVRGRKSS